MLSTLCYNNHNTTSLSHLSFFLMRTVEILFWLNGPGFSSFCLIFLVCQHILFRHDKLYITSCQQSTISFDNFPHFGFFLVDSGLTKVELFSVFIFLNEQNEVGSLQRSQDRPYAIYHILQFYAFLFDLIFDVFEVMNQCLKEILLFLQKLSFGLNLFLLFLWQVQSASQFHKPLVFVHVIIIEQMPAFWGRPHHIPVKSR